MMARVAAKHAAPSHVKKLPRVKTSTTSKATLATIKPMTSQVEAPTSVFLLDVTPPAKKLPGKFYCPVLPEGELKCSKIGKWSVIFPSWKKQQTSENS